MSKPREAGGVLGSRVTFWGALRPAGPPDPTPVQEEPEQKLFEVFHIGRVCEGRLHNYPLVTQIWDSIQAGFCDVGTDQILKIWCQYKTCFGRYVALELKVN